MLLRGMVFRLLHHRNKPVEEPPGIQRAAAGLRVELNGEDGYVFIVDALARPVVAVDHAGLRRFRQSVGEHGVAVVLARDEDPARGCFQDGLIGAPVPVMKFFCFGTLAQGEQLVTQTDAEGGDVICAELPELGDNADVVGRVPRTVCEHDAVGLHCPDLLGCRRAGEDRDIAAALLQLAADVILCAEIPERHLVVVFIGRQHVRHLRRGILDAFPDDVGFERRLFRRRQLRLFGDHRVHDAAFPDDFCHRARIQTVQAGNAVIAQKSVKRAFTPEIRRLLTPLSHNIRFYLDFGAFKIGRDHAVIADQRERLDHNLSVIARVGERFEISGHSGVENKFADSLTFISERLPFKHGAVFQN